MITSFTYIFLIYISRVFDKVAKYNLALISLFFIDDLGFIGFEYSVKEFAKTLADIAKIVLE